MSYSDWRRHCDSTYHSSTNKSYILHVGNTQLQQQQLAFVHHTATVFDLRFPCYCTTNITTTTLFHQFAVHHLQASSNAGCDILLSLLTFLANSFNNDITSLSNAVHHLQASSNAGCDILLSLLTFLANSFNNDITSLANSAGTGFFPAPQIRNRPVQIQLLTHITISHY